MMMKNTFFLICFLLLCINSFSQSAQKNNLVAVDKTKEDFLAFEAFKQEHPEVFRKNRLPVHLLDGNYLINGYSSSIELIDNPVSDSVEHNFYTGMPDTSTTIPFSGLKAGGKRIVLNLFFKLPISDLKIADSGFLSPADENTIVNGKIGDIEIADFGSETIQVRISVNGKILFDWRPLHFFTRQAFKAGQTYHSAPGHSAVLESYNYGYRISDTAISVNDQVLVEIKETQHNWMIDRFNITRSAAVPEVAYIKAGNEMISGTAHTGNDKMEKKSSY